MTGQMQRYKDSLEHTAYTEVNPALLKVRIDYRGLMAYARQKGVSVPELKDDEKNRFILNSDMSKIREMRKDETASIA